MQCSITKASKGMHATASLPAKAGDPAPTSFNLFVDETGKSFTVFGINAMGNPVAISSVASITATSANPAVATVGAPVGASFSIAAAVPNPAPGVADTVTVVATWNDGSVGPFTLTITFNTVADPILGLILQPTAVVVS
jgi:hypothetical protein